MVLEKLPKVLKYERPKCGCKNTVFHLMEKWIEGWVMFRVFGTKTK
jgi:hypothetical protein